MTNQKFIAGGKIVEIRERNPDKIIVGSLIYDPPDFVRITSNKAIVAGKVVEASESRKFFVNGRLYEVQVDAAAQVHYTLPRVGAFTDNETTEQIHVAQLGALTGQPVVEYESPGAVTGTIPPMYHHYSKNIGSR